MFIENDEHILIMDDGFRPMCLDDFKKLEDCGIKTIFIHRTMKWHLIQPKEDSPYDWSSLDKRIEIALKSNLKLIVPFFRNLPCWVEKNWFLDFPPKFQGRRNLYCAINYINPDTGIAIDRFAKATLEHLATFHHPIQVVCMLICDGEFPRLPSHETPPVPYDVLAQFIVERQKIFVPQYNEVWTAYHNVMPQLADHIPIINQAMCDNFPDTQFYSIQFNHFSLEWYPVLKDITIKFQNVYKIRYFMGSNYVAGIRKYIDKALDQKIWGFLTAPIHHETNHLSITPGLTETISNANKALQYAWRNRI